jgi:hypothetical protein
MKHPEHGQHDEDEVIPLDDPGHADLPALDALVREMKARPLPAPEAGDDLEERLMARIAAGEQPSYPLVIPPRRDRGGQLIVLGGIVLAAAAALMLWWQGPKQPSPMARIEPSAAPIVVPTATAFGVTTHVESGSKPERVSVYGLASWVFDPGSVAEVTQGTNRVDVRLERGAIEVDVVPQPVPERFVVIAGTTRVAVKGTRFRVARIDDHTEVDVEHGTVSVTSLGATPVPARLLVGPAAASVVEGGPGDATPRPFRPFGVAPATATSTAMVELKPAPRVLQPHGEDPHPRPDQASRCFQENARPSPNVRVSVSTTLVLDVGAGGVASSFLFEPRLSPNTEACFTAGLAGLQGPAGRHTLSLDLIGRR